MQRLCTVLIKFHILFDHNSTTKTPRKVLSIYQEIHCENSILSLTFKTISWYLGNSTNAHTNSLLGVTQGSLYSRPLLFLPRLTPMTAKSPLPVLTDLRTHASSTLSLSLSLSIHSVSLSILYPLCLPLSLFASTLSPSSQFFVESRPSPTVITRTSSADGARAEFSLLNRLADVVTWATKHVLLPV